MSLSTLIRLCFIGGLLLVLGKQFFLSFVLERVFDSGRFLMSFIYTTIVLGLPVYFFQLSKREGELQELSTAHTLGFVLGFFTLYLILFFSRLIMYISFFAKSPFYLIVEFVMMIAVLVVLSMPFIYAEKKARQAVDESNGEM